MRLRQHLRRHPLRLVVAATLALVTVAPPAHAAARPARGTQARLLVKFQPGTSSSAAATAVAKAGGTVTRRISALGVEVVSVPAAASASALRSLRAVRSVQYAEADGHGVADEVVPNDPQWTNQWGPRKVGAPVAWKTTTGVETTVVAVLDSGVDAAHPDLQGSLLPGYDFVNNDADPADDNGHGTKATGILAARTNNATGLAGMCWGCKILPVKVLDSAGYASWSNVASGLTWAADHGADIISMSISGSSGSTTLLNAVQYATSRGVIVITSAGNTGDTVQRYPAAYSGVIAVSGSDSADGRYSWSTYGDWVDVAAPGCSPTTLRGGTYGSFCGTSAATPATAGAAALLASVSGATKSSVESALLGTAVPVPFVGRGRIDAAAAMATVAPATSPEPSPSPTSDPTPAPTTEPSPEPTTSPSPTPTSDPAAEPSPTPTPQESTTPQLVTSSFSGSFNKSSTVARHQVTAGGGELTATLSAKADVRFELRDAAGAVLASGTGGGKLTKVVPAGTYTFVVSGARGSYTLTVTYPAA